MSINQLRNFHKSNILTLMFAKLSLSAFIHIIVGLGLLIFSKTLVNELVLDNIPQIVQNPQVHKFDIVGIFTTSAVYPGQENSLNFYYKPIMYLVFAFIYPFF